MATVSMTDQRAYVKIEIVRGRNTTEIRSALVEACGDQALSYLTIEGLLGFVAEDSQFTMILALVDFEHQPTIITFNLLYGKCRNATYRHATR